MADHLAMSDEDFLKQPVPETGQASSDTPPATIETPVVEQEEPAETPAEQVETPAVVEDKPAEQPPAEEPAKAPEAAPEGVEPVKDPVASGSEVKEEEKPAETPNYEAFYAEIMKPFHANGKEIKLKSPQEAVQLMQMGANYTRKMQDIAPHRKVLTMLQKNGLDEDKLSFLIDLDKGDPEAIKKFIKDKGVDPLDIDTTTEPAYREGSHKVSDAEQAFTSALDELNSTPAGKQTLVVVESTWDQTSKDMLWSQPEVLSIIKAQREAGVYDIITAEMDRQKTLGQLPADRPFIDAYYATGEQLQKAGAFAHLVEADQGKPAPGAGTTVDTQAGKPAPTPVATTTAKPKSDDAAAKAAAAAPSRSSPAQAKTAVNVLAMSDEEFLKLGRLPS